MDIQSATNLLISHFKTSDVFNANKHFRQLSWESLGEEENKSLTDEEAKEAIEIALNDLEENKIIRRKDKSSKNKIYIVTESFKNSPTNLFLSRKTAGDVKQVVESVLPMISLDYEYDPKSDVCEMDIVLLLQTIVLLKNELDEQVKNNEIKPKLTGEGTKEN